MADEYEQLKKRHNLPDFKVLNNELDMSGLEDSKNPLMFITKRIAERLEYFSEIIGNLLQPNNDTASMYEFSAFSDEDREKIPEVYKRLMYLQRECLEKELDLEEVKGAEFINKFFNDWTKMKKELTSIISTMKESWKRENRLKLDLEHYG